MNAWIAKQKYLIDFTLTSLARRKAKTLGLLLVYTLIVFLLASVMLFSHALRHEAAHVLDGAPEVLLQRMVAGRHDLIPPDYLERLGRIRGVQHKEGRLWGYYYDPVIKANYTFMAPSREEIARGTLVVGAGLAKARGLTVGNTISFRAYSGRYFGFTIARILPRDTELVSADLVLLNEADFRAFFEIPTGHFTDTTEHMTASGWPMEHWTLTSRRPRKRTCLSLCRTTIRLDSPDCRPTPTAASYRCRAHSIHILIGTNSDGRQPTSAAMSPTNSTTNGVRPSRATGESKASSSKTLTRMPGLTPPT